MTASWYRTTVDGIAVASRGLTDAEIGRAVRTELLARLARLDAATVGWDELLEAELREIATHEQPCPEPLIRRAVSVGAEDRARLHLEGEDA